MLYPDLGQRPTAEPGLFFAHDYWSGETIPVNATTTITIPPHGVRLFAVRQVHPDRPAFLGSTLHMSQGLEVGQWQSPSEPGNTHKITLQTAAPLIGMATFYLPRQTDKDRWRIAAIATPDQLTYLPFEASPNHTVQVEITCNQQVEIILQETIRPNSQPGA
jgi:hypothetical protein